MNDVRGLLAQCTNEYFASLGIRVPKQRRFIKSSCRHDTVHRRFQGNRNIPCLNLTHERQLMPLLNEHLIRKFSIRLNTIINRHSQSTKHDSPKPRTESACEGTLRGEGYESSPSSTRLTNHIKVLARLWGSDRVLISSISFLRACKDDRPRTPPIET